MDDGGAAERNKDQETPEREALCRRCGVCCHEKVRFGEQVVITDIPCPYLDLKTNLCAVYPDRLVKQPRCSSAEDSVKANSLPRGCPYIKGRRGYLIPHLLADHPEYEQAVNTLFPERKEGRLKLDPAMAGKRKRKSRARR